MKAIVRYKYGSTDVLELKDIDKPEIGDDEVLVGVHAAGVDRGVWHLMTGLAYPIRLAGYGLRVPKNPVLGRDLAGVVETVGKNVSRFQPGDEVFGIGEGSFAEYARARADKLAPKPANLTFEQAATVPISGVTALQGLRDVGKVQPGQRYDLIFDIAGNRSLSHLRRALAPRGTLVIVGGEGGGRWFGGLDRQLIRAPLVSLFVNQTLRPLSS